MITCDEIISVMGIVSTNMTSTIAKNGSIIFDDKKVRYEIDCYILHTLSDHITIDNYYYLLSLCKT